MRILVYETAQHEIRFYPTSHDLKNKGYEVDTFDPSLILNLKIELISRILRKFFVNILMYEINKRFIEKFTLKNYDLVLIVRGEHLKSSTLEFIKKNNCKLVNWSSDDFFNEATTLKILPKNEVVEVLKSYDCIFTPRIHLKDEYLAFGAKKVEPLDWYYRPRLKYSPDQVPASNYLYDVSFVGAWSPRREFILNSLSEPVNIWGWGWSKHAQRSFVKKNIIHGYINMAEMMEIFNKSKININILTLENRDTTNFRNYEIPQAGGFQISEWSKEIASLFAEDIEIVLFKSNNELVEKIAKYLENTPLREEILKNSFKKIDTYDCSIESRTSFILDNI
ncbi:glycosyltransferase [Polynucleobacter paneuropaeus]|nr:glycosyltransferase [Polynucleobacter paneuropaeus]